MSIASIESSAITDRNHAEVDGELTIEVFSPRSAQSMKFSWPKSFQVGEAADQAAKAFGYEAGNPTFQVKTGEVLNREKTLIEAGIHDLDQLELTDKGGGV